MSEEDSAISTLTKEYDSLEKEITEPWLKEQLKNFYLTLVSENVLSNEEYEKGKLQDYVEEQRGIAEGLPCRAEEFSVLSALLKKPDYRERIGIEVVEHEKLEQYVNDIVKKSGPFYRKAILKEE